MMAEWTSRKCSVGVRVPARELGLSLALATMLLVLSTAALSANYAAPEACVPGPHSGTITADEDWCLADSPHLVYGGVTVAAGATVSVEPGVEIVLTEGDGGLYLNGRLIAEGTSTEPITLTSQSGHWAGVVAYAGSQLRLAYCDVGYAAGDYWHTAISVQSGADVDMRHCRIHHMLGAGLKLVNDGLSGVFEDLEIDHNSLEAVWQNTVTMNPTYSNLRLHDNGLDAVNIVYDVVDQGVVLDGSPAALNGAPIHLEGATVNAGYTLTVTPGTLLKMREGVGLDVYGTLIAEGTSTEPITLASQSGHWQGVTARSGSRLRLAYCDVGYAGGDYWQTAMWVYSGADVEMRHCRIHHMLGVGLRLVNDGLSGVFEDLEIDHNGLEAVLQNTVTMNPTYSNLRLHDNGLDAVNIVYDVVDQGVVLDGSPAALNGAPIHLEGATVNAGYTLTVTPGTLLKMREGVGLDVYGTLIAEGTPTEPITLASQSGNWQGVTARSGSRLRLAYCDVGYAGGDYWQTAMWVYSGADVEMRHCRIHHMLGVGLRLVNDGLSGVFEDLEIDHNSLEAVLQNTVTMNPTYSNLRLHDNGLDAVNIVYDVVDQDVVLDGSPAALNGAPIHLEGATVNAGYTLTVVPGTLLKMREGSGGLYLNGTLVAEGTPTEPITLTSQSGHWAGLVAYGGSQLRLAYCDVGYAGGDYSRRAMQVSTSDAQIHGCRIHHSLGNGLNVDAAQITVRNVALVDNALVALWLASGARVDGRHLTLARNGTGVYAAQGTAAVLTNTILAQNTTGVNVASGGSATLAHTLWDNNTTPIVGTVDETGHLQGLAAFDADGYHILPRSEAVQRGLNVGVADDIDGDPRPLPVGTSPDLGADENPVPRHSYAYLPLVLRQYR